MSRGERAGVRPGGGGCVADGFLKAERNSQWNVTLGATHDMDMFEDTPTTLVADVYLEQSKLEKDDQTFGLELGTRHQVDEDMVLDVGIARDLSGARDRDDFRLTVGVSLGLGHS